MEELSGFCQFCVNFFTPASFVLVTHHSSLAVEAVTAAAHGDQIATVGWPGLDLLAKIDDVGVHHAVDHEAVTAPDWADENVCTSAIYLPVQTVDLIRPGRVSCRRVSPRLGKLRLLSQCQSRRD